MPDPVIVAEPAPVAPEPASNRWARAARHFAKLAHGRPTTRLVVFVALAIAWLTFTIVGSFKRTGLDNMKAAPDLLARIGDALYGPITFLTPQDSYAFNIEPYSALWFGRFPGVALPVLALVWAAARSFGSSIARVLVRRARGHVVIIGRDGFADTVARRTSEQGECVVLVEEGIEGARAAELSRAGVVVFPDLTLLSTALRAARAPQAQLVMCWSSSDAQSLADALEVRALVEGSRDEVVVHVDSPETMRVLRHAPDLLSSDEGRLRPISPTFSAVRRGISDAAMVESALAQGLERVHVQLHGSTPALEIAAMLALRHNWSTRLGAPWVSFDYVPAGRWVSWRRRLAQLKDQITLAMAGDDLPRLFRTRQEARDAGAVVSWYIVDLGDDDETLAHSYDLASRLVQEHGVPPKVQPVLRRAHSARAVLAQSKIVGAFADPILLDEPRSAGELVARGEDRTAAEIHLAYTRGTDPSAAAGMDWHQLPETFLHANRAAADHRSIKAADAAAASEAGTSREDLVAAMCRVEHNRWVSERVLDGWIHGTPRADARRIHDKLVPWDQLNEADRQKDYDQVRLTVDKVYGPAPVAAAPTA